MTLEEAGVKMETSRGVEWAHPYEIHGCIRIECEFRGARASDLRAIAAIMDELAGSYPVYKTEF